MGDSDEKWRVYLRIKGSKYSRVAPPDEGEDGDSTDYYDEQQARERALAESLREDVEKARLRRRGDSEDPERDEHFKDGRCLGLHMFSNQTSDQ